MRERVRARDEAGAELCELSASEWSDRRLRDERTGGVMKTVTIGHMMGIGTFPRVTTPGERVTSPIKNKGADRHC